MLSVKVKLKKRKDKSFLFSKLQKNLPLVVALVISLDQGSKYIAVAFLPFACNRGIAFGLPVGNLIFSVAVLFVLLGLIYFENSKRNILALALIFTGGLSNFVDRVFFGCVRDFIDFRIFPAFNLADVAISIGVVLIIFNLINTKNET